MKDIMKALDVAKRANISVATFRRWQKKGWGPPCRKKPSGMYSYDPEDVETWLKNMTLPGWPQTGIGENPELQSRSPDGGNQ